MDRWILSSLNSLKTRVTEAYDQYEPTQAGREIEEFVDSQLSNWYVRLCRRRFWKGEYEHDKKSAYQTLYECMETICLMMAPVAPFFADWMFNNLNRVSGRIKANSVHHADFPVAQQETIDKNLEERMRLAQDVCSLILSLRKKVNIKVRQPLQKVFVPAMTPQMAADIGAVTEIIKTETNIKEIELLDANNDFIRKKAKANFKTLGKKLGPLMKAVAGEVEKMDNTTIDQVLKGGYSLPASASLKEAVQLDPEDIEVVTDEIPGYEVAVKGNLTVALDISITEQLQHEGNAREFVNRIQNIRRDNGFELTDRIRVSVDQNALQTSLMEYKDYICREILADTLEFVPVISDGLPIEVNEIQLKVNVIKSKV
jgi:isoleucyl-tRNA synthetase